jgi:Phage integrase family
LPFVFVLDRGTPLSAPGFSRLVERAAEPANFGIKAHAHMLRHACGYKLANDGHETRAIQERKRVTAISNKTRTQRIIFAASMTIGFICCAAQIGCAALQLLNRHVPSCKRRSLTPSGLSFTAQTRAASSHGAPPQRPLDVPPGQ